MAPEAQPASSDVGHDIFLDFLNRDSRQYFGIYRTLGRDQELRILEEALNCAVFLTRDVCMLPPGFLLEDRLVRDLISQKEAFRYERLMRLPVRESLDELWAKKEREYASVRDQYEGLFDSEGQKFVADNRHLLVEREFEVGTTFVARWEAAPDVSSDEWAGQWVRRFPPGVIELFRRIPRRLHERGEAVTWANINTLIQEVASRHPTYRALVQHIYFAIYTDLLGLRVLTGLPFGRYDFGLGSKDTIAYDYEALRTVVEPTELWRPLLSMAAERLVALRKTEGYFKFRETYFDLCSRCSTHYRLREACAVPHETIRGIRDTTEVADRLASDQLLLPLTDGLTGDQEALEAFGHRLTMFAREALERAGSQQAESKKGRRLVDEAIARARRGGLAVADGSPIILGVFAALESERKILIREWGLSPLGGGSSRWSGSLAEDVEVLLYSADLMGRVPAAVETARLLADVKPDAIVVTGVAGGFAESDVRLGNILVPDLVVDLAHRKVTTNDEGADRQVRPSPYELDKRLLRYLDQDFGNQDWAMRVAKDLEWPDGSYPVFRFGKSIACGDEVIANDAARKEMLKLWPGLLGVEMECGGVAAAARSFFGTALPIFQLRVVSDMADPAKTDTTWRTLGVKTLAHLIQSIEWRRVLGAGG